jgi:Protein of unknown function (DUF4019)
MSKQISRALFLSLIVFANNPEFLSGQQSATTQVQVQAAPQQQTQEQDKNLKDSLAASNAWLNLVDQGKYGESWDAGAMTYQFTISRNEWIKAMTLARQPLGQAVSRELIRQDPAVNPKNLPAGNYMVIYYKSAFSNRPNAHERVILQQQNNGQWKMLTYDVS